MIQTPAKLPDLHYVDGKFEHIPDVLGDEDETNLDELLAKRGWSQFNSVGADGAYMYMTTYRRIDEQGVHRFLMYVDTVSTTGPAILVDSFADLMDLLSRWAPAVQTAGLLGLVAEVVETSLQRNGIVEAIASRSAWGASQSDAWGAEQLRNERELRRAAKGDLKPSPRDPDVF